MGGHTLQELEWLVRFVRRSRAMTSVRDGEARTVP
jgi:hypothetical protein